MSKVAGRETYCFNCERQRKAFESKENKRGEKQIVKIKGLVFLSNVFLPQRSYKLHSKIFLQRYPSVIKLPVLAMVSKKWLFFFKNESISYMS